MITLGLVWGHTRKKKSFSLFAPLTCFRRCKHSPRALSQIQSTLSKLTLSKCSAVHVTAVTDFTWPRRCCRHSPLTTSQTRTPPLAAPLTTCRLLVYSKKSWFLWVSKHYCRRWRVVAAAKMAGNARCIKSYASFLGNGHLIKPTLRLHLTLSTVREVMLSAWPCNV